MRIILMFAISFCCLSMPFTSFAAGIGDRKPIVICSCGEVVAGTGYIGYAMKVSMSSPSGDTHYGKFNTVNLYIDHEKRRNDALFKECRIMIFDSPECPKNPVVENPVVAN